MRLTQAVLKQHLARMFKKKWHHRGKKVPLESGIEEELKAKGIPVYMPEDILRKKHESIKLDVIGFEPKPVPVDERHPLYHAQPCHMFHDQNVLLEGLQQAKVLTKSIEGPGFLSGPLAAKDVTRDHDELVKSCIMASHVFDPMQEKLPKRKDPFRPAWNFPRELGITDFRKNRLTCQRLLRICEALSPVEARSRSVLEDGHFVSTVEKEGDLIQLDLRADLLVTSDVPLSPPAGPETVRDTHHEQLPVLDPIKHTVTLEQKHFYESRSEYPLSEQCPHSHLHTAIVHYNHTEVSNIYETPVTDEQILGRTLMKSFAFAAARAQQLFGNNVRELPEPVTLQCVHTDGRWFHFAALQLNTLNLDGEEGTKNIFWHAPPAPLFSSCQYHEGRPQLRNYDGSVFARLLAFYRSGG